MRIFALVFVLAAASACGPKAQTTPPPATAAREPPPATQPPPAQTPPPSAPDRRPEVISQLDAIDHELHEAVEHKMVHVDKHAHAIHEHVTALADPISAFPQAADAYAELKTQAHKFLQAAQANDHHDLHDHHGHLVELVKRLRAEVGG